jgi:hypothetical protein
MSPYGSNHRYGVDVWRFENRARIGCYFDRRIAAFSPREGIHVFVTEHFDASVFLSMKIPDDVGAPVSVSDDSDSYHMSPAVNLWIFGYENKNTARCHSPLSGPPFLTLSGQGNLPDCGKNVQEDSKALHK